MKALKRSSVFLVLGLCLGCVDEELKFKEDYDSIVETRAKKPFSADQLFDLQSSSNVFGVIMQIYDGSLMGRKLLESLLSSRGGVKIKVVFDGSLSEGMMDYNGGDIIRYGAGLIPYDDIFATLLFHEIFHVYQIQYKRSTLNDEIEAYVVAWLMFEELPNNKSYSPCFLDDPIFHKYITELASLVNKKRGEIKDPNNRFHKVYGDALEYLKNHRLYKNRPIDIGGNFNILLKFLND